MRKKETVKPILLRRDEAFVFFFLLKRHIRSSYSTQVLTTPFLNYGIQYTMIKNQRSLTVTIPELQNSFQNNCYQLQKIFDQAKL